MSTPNEYTDNFKSNLTCIFLSCRAKLKKTLCPRTLCMYPNISFGHNLKINISRSSITKFAFSFTFIPADIVVYRSRFLMQPKILLLQLLPKLLIRNSIFVPIIIQILNHKQVKHLKLYLVTDFLMSHIERKCRYTYMRSKKLIEGWQKL